MAGSTTTYKVDIQYDLKGSAAGGLKTIDQQAKSATHSLGGLRSIMAAVGGSLFLREAKKALIDFNSEVQDAKIGLAAMIQGNLGGSFAKAAASASSLYDEFQRFSTQTPVMTQDILNFGKGIAVAAFQAGGSIRDMTNLTEQGVIAAKAFGYETNYAALEISEMLAGNAQKRMMFARNLLGIAKMDTKEFNKLSSGKRLDVLKSVLNSDAMKNAATAFSQSWSGVLSTFKDKLQILIGKVGLPLFKQLTAEVLKWNTWIDKNTVKIAAFGESLSHGLMTGFHYVKEAITFLVDHADTLLAIGKVWLATRAAGMLGGAFGFGGMNGGAIMASLSPIGAMLSNQLRAGVLSFGLRFPSLMGRMMRTGSALSGVGGAAGALGIPGIAAVGMGAYELSKAVGFQRDLADAIDPMRAKLDLVTTSMGKLDEATQHAAQALANIKGAGGTPGSSNMLGLETLDAQKANVISDAIRAGLGVTSLATGGMDSTRLMGKLRGTGLFDADELNKIAANPEAARNAYGLNATTLKMRRQTATREADAAWARIPDQLKKNLDQQAVTAVLFSKELDLLGKFVNGGYSNGVAITPQMVDAILHSQFAADLAPKRHDVNVTINKIEVYSDDPDRFVAQAVNSFEEVVRNPTMAHDIIRGAF